VAFEISAACELGHAALKRGLSCSALISGPVVFRGMLHASPEARFLPHLRATNATMRTMAVIFVLALITVAFEIYSDAALTSAEVSHTFAPDPVTAAVAHALKHG
jgi:hypothetical protein